MANTIIHHADSRGRSKHSWLSSHHTFSFSGYYHPDRMRFGTLRVLNDDTVAGGGGFGLHPHDNMEIVSLPLEGALRHEDSMGNTATIQTGDVQVMSAGTGIRHSEWNASTDKPVKFLQIWVFPNRQNVAPRYQQITLQKADRRNRLQTIVAPEPQAGSTWIHQNAWFSLGHLQPGWKDRYTLHDPDNGVYAFVISGNVTIDGQQLSARDGMGISAVANFPLEATSDTELLLMEVPMQLR